MWEKSVATKGDNEIYNLKEEVGNEGGVAGLPERELSLYPVHPQTQLLIEFTFS